MSKRLVVGMTALVAVAHWALLFSPWFGPATPVQPSADTPNVLEAVWIPLPPPRPVAAPAHVSPLTPAPPKPRASTPPATVQAPSSPSQTPVVDAPSPAPTTAALTTTSNAPDAQAALPPQAEEPPQAEDPAASAAAAHSASNGPRLRVQDAAGAPVTLELSSDGSTLAQHKLLRFQVAGFVKGMQYHAQAELEWHIDGNRYQARQRISAFLLGSMEQTSQGLLTPLGLQPLEFTDRRFAKRRSVTLDWEARQASFTPLQPATPIGPGTQDRLSVFLQLAAILHSTPDLRAAGTRLQVPTLGSRRMQIWTFEVQAPEMLDLPGGATPTLRLRRIPPAGEAEQALLWLDATQGYAPVRIHMEEPNGDVMDFVLQD
ncbi:DUF3108 domain-containing protein [Comamonas jiangduensis]|uniref:DUF3108 domain-containing protein n=1 Tax=Comamonas jiangduensis TaxID=1194168 RepID=UPI003BF84373